MGLPQSQHNSPGRATELSVRPSICSAARHAQIVPPAARYNGKTVNRLFRFLLRLATLVSLILCAVIARQALILSSPRHLLVARPRSGACWLTTERTSISLSAVRDLPIPDWYLKGGAPRA